MSSTVTDWVITQDMLTEDIVFEQEIANKYPRRIIVTGSGVDVSYEEFCRIIDEYVSFIHEPFLLLCRDSKWGVDAMARQWAAEHKQLCWPFPLPTDSFGFGADRRQNATLLEYCTELIAFDDKLSYATKNIVHEARYRETPVKHLTYSALPRYEIYTVTKAQATVLYKAKYTIVDVSRSSKHRVFLPDAALWRKLDEERITPDTFDQNYVDALARSWKPAADTDEAGLLANDYWQRAVRHKKIAVCSDEPYREYSHRNSFARQLRLFLLSTGQQVIDHGEYKGGEIGVTPDLVEIIRVEHKDDARGPLTHLGGVEVLTERGFSIDAQNDIADMPLIYNLTRRFSINDGLRTGYRADMDLSGTLADPEILALLAPLGYRLARFHVTPVLEVDPGIVFFVDHRTQ